MMKSNNDETMTEEEERWKREDDISRKLDENRKALEERIGLNSSFDVLFREMVFGTKKVGLLYINGFAKDDVLTEILKRLSYLKREDLVPDTLKSFLEKYVLHIQVEEVKTMSDAVDKVMVGASILFIDQENVALMIDAKQFPARGMEEPSLETVVRGSRDGFNETLLTNVTLVRRRLRDPRLKMEIHQVGRRTQIGRASCRERV